MSKTEIITKIETIRELEELILRHLAAGLGIFPALRPLPMGLGVHLIVIDGHVDHRRFRFLNGLAFLSIH